MQRGWAWPLRNPPAHCSEALRSSGILGWITSDNPTSPLTISWSVAPRTFWSAGPKLAASLSENRFILAGAFDWKRFIMAWSENKCGKFLKGHFWFWRLQCLFNHQLPGLMIQLLACGQIHAFRVIFSSFGSTGVIRDQNMSSATIWLDFSSRKSTMSLCTLLF